MSRSSRCFPSLSTPSWTPASSAGDRGRLVAVDRTNPRDFGLGKHRSVDDAPYGGGRGMVMRPDPSSRAIDAIEPARARPPGPPLAVGPPLTRRRPPSWPGGRGAWCAGATRASTSGCSATPTTRQHRRLRAGRGRAGRAGADRSDGPAGPRGPRLQRVPADESFSGRTARVPAVHPPAGVAGCRARGAALGRPQGHRSLAPPGSVAADPGAAPRPLSLATPSPDDDSGC